MKKLLAVLLTLLIVLAGCAKKEPAQDNATVFKNEDVRKAISYAIDREALVKTLNDGSIAAEGIIPFKLATNPSTGADFRDDQGKLVSYDPDKAKELYAKACEELGVKQITIDLDEVKLTLDRERRENAGAGFAVKRALGA